MPAAQAPDPETRVLAFLIDALIVVLLSGLPVIGALLGVGYIVTRDGLNLAFMNQRSVGKHVMGLRVERLDGRPITLETSVLRNWMWGLGPVIAGLSAVPLFGPATSSLVALLGGAVGLYELFRVLTRDDGRRWGDDLAQTQVVG